MQFNETAKILLTVLFAVIIAVAAYYLVITFVVDPYLQNGTWKLISNNFETYNNDSLKTTPKIYFIGNSQIMAAVDPDAIQKELSSKNESYAVYNLGVNFDTPLQRSIELSDLIQSKPALVIYGDSYCSFSSRYRYVPDDNLALVSDKIHLDDYSRSLFDQDQLTLIEQNKVDQIFFKRKFIISSIKQNLGIQLGGRDVIVNDSLTIEEKKIIAQNPYDEFLAPVDAEDNVQKKAFLHMRDEFEKNNISFIYVHMPMDSLRVATIPESTKINYFTFLNSTGVKYYNLESSYSDDNFYDLVHLNKYGKQRFSQDMPTLIIPEIK
jgi:hypothetical protein